MREGVKKGEGRAQGTVVMDHGCFSGGRTVGTTPEGRNQLLYNNKQWYIGNKNFADCIRFKKLARGQK